MPKLLPDQSFYPSPTMAMQAPAETLAYVALLNPDPTASDALAVLDVDPASPGYGAQIARVDMPGAGDELHHFGWNACSSCLCPNSPHPHMQRRYLVVPGMRSSRIHILDTAPDPRQPRLVKVIEAEEVIRKTGYSRPHTAHCGPDGIYVNALGNADGNGPGGIFVLDPETFEIKGRVGEGSRTAAAGVRLLVAPRSRHDDHQRVGHAEDGGGRRESGAAPGRQVRQRAARVGSQQPPSLQKLELGPEQQMVLELRPAHDPNETYGFVGVVTSLKDLSASVWMWHREGSGRSGTWRIRQGDRDSRRAGGSRRSAAALQGLRRGAAARHRHQPLARRSIPLRLVLRHRRAEAIRRIRSLQPRRDRLGEARGHRSSPGAPGASGPAAEWRAADGRDQPRRQARLRDQLAVSHVGRPVLSRRRQGLAGQEWTCARTAASSSITPASCEFDGMRPHQVHLEGGDASSDSYCFA